MDAICGLGIPELIVIAALAFVLIGPDRSQEVALQAGRFLRNVMSSQWWGDVNEVVQAIQNLPTTLVRMAELEETQEEMREVMQEIDRDIRSVAQETQEGISDPWGISQATAETTFTPRPEPTDEMPDDLVEPDEPTDTLTDELEDTADDH